MPLHSQECLTYEVPPGRSTRVRYVSVHVCSLWLPLEISHVIYHTYISMLYTYIYCIWCKKCICNYIIDSRRRRYYAVCTLADARSRDTSKENCWCRNIDQKEILIKRWFDKWGACICMHACNHAYHIRKGFAVLFTMTVI